MVGGGENPAPSGGDLGERSGPLNQRPNWYAHKCTGFRRPLSVVHIVFSDWFDAPEQALSSRPFRGVSRMPPIGLPIWIATAPRHPMNLILKKGLTRFSDQINAKIVE